MLYKVDQLETSWEQTSQCPESTGQHTFPTLTLTILTLAVTAEAQCQSKTQLLCVISFVLFSHCLMGLNKFKCPP